MLKNELDVNLSLLDLFAWLADLGYLGLGSGYDVAPDSLPHRKPRRSKKAPDTALNDTQRADNRAHARRRVKVEHAISGAKHLGCVNASLPQQVLGLQRPADGLGVWYLELASYQLMLRSELGELLIHGF